MRWPRLRLQSLMTLVAVLGVALAVFEIQRRYRATPAVRTITYPLEGDTVGRPGERMEVEVNFDLGDAKAKAAFEKTVAKLKAQRVPFEVR